MEALSLNSGFFLSHNTVPHTTRAKPRAETGFCITQVLLFLLPATSGVLLVSEGWRKIKLFIYLLSNQVLLDLCALNYLTSRQLNLTYAFPRRFINWNLDSLYINKYIIYLFILLHFIKENVRCCEDFCRKQHKQQKTECVVLNFAHKDQK